MKILALLALLALSLPFVHASTIDFDVNTDFKSSITNGVGQFGEFIIVNKPLISSNYNITNYTISGAQIGDAFIWQGTDTLSMYLNDVFIGFLSPSNSLTLSSVGTYTYAQSSNLSVNGSIIVTSISPITINIQLNGNPVNYTFEPASFLFNMSDKLIKVNYSVLEEVSTGEYNWTLNVSSANKSVVKNGTTRVVENRAWNITSSTVPSNFTIKSGSAEPIGEVNVINLGNADFSIHVDLYGDGAKFIRTQENQTLFKRTSGVFNFIAQVPSVTTHGSYNTTVVMTGGNKTETFSFMIVVTDMLPPEIKRVSFLDDFIYHDNIISVDVTDNIQVANVSIEYDGVLYNMTRDQQLFTYAFKPDRLSQYLFTVCAYDDTNNVVCQEINKTFMKLNIINYTPEVRMPSRKTGAYASTTLFNLSEKPPHAIKIKLVDFAGESVNTTVGGNYKLRVVDGDGTVYQFNSLGEEINVFYAGQIKIEVTGDEQSSYDGILLVTPQDYMENLTGPIHIHGKFLSYDIPNSFIINDWYGGKPFSCEVIDTGDLDTSEYDCKVKFPITLDVKNFAVPTTPSEKLLYDENKNNTIAGIRGEVLNRNFAISGLAAIILILSLLLVWGAKYYPYFRYRINGT